MLGTLATHRVVLELNDLELAQLDHLAHTARIATNAPLIIKLIAALELAQPSVVNGGDESMLLQRQAE